MTTGFFDKDSSSAVLDMLCIFVIPVSIALILTRVIFMILWVPSGSMQPTIRINQLIIADRLAYKNEMPQRGDIIVFNHIDHNNTILVKRVIATEGETVTFADGDVYINGMICDSFSQTHNTYPSEKCSVFTVPQGCVFVLGDNREHSNDSRFWEHPFVCVSDIYGKVYKE